MLDYRILHNAVYYISMLSNLLLALVPRASYACTQSVMVTLTGPTISDIPRNLAPDVGYLKLSNTNITILNLTATGDYPVMCRLEINSSPLTTIITPYPPQTVPLTDFHLAAGNFPTPPNLGIVLPGQLEYLVFKGIGVVTIPDNYFQNYTSLISLSLTNNPISDLNAKNMAGLRNLQKLYLVNTDVSSLAEIHTWLPYLKGIYVSRSEITALSAFMVEHLSNLQTLDISRNALRTIPTEKHFVNLANMVSVNLEGNPLHCDSRLCWVKVMAMTMGNITTSILEYFSSLLWALYWLVSARKTLAMELCLFCTNPSI